MFLSVPFATPRYVDEDGTGLLLWLEHGKTRSDLNR